MDLLRDATFFILFAVIPALIIAIRYRVSESGVLLSAGILLGAISAVTGLFHGQEIIILAGEFGVAAILFQAGTEMSPESLKKMLRDLWLGGGVQMLVTLAAGCLFYHLVFDGSWAKAIFVGILVTPSSTPIVHARLAATNKLRTRAGISAMGILVAQDLGLLPYSFLIPILAGRGSGPWSAVVQMLLGAAIVGLVYLIEAKLADRVLDWISEMKKPELSISVALGLILIMAYTMGSRGLSPVLGVFLAGIFMSGTKHVPEMLGFVHIFRVMLGPFFFLATGLLFDIKFVSSPTNLVVLIASVVGLVILKVLTGYITGRILGHTPQTAFRLAGILAHIGETSFILALIGRPLGLFTPEDNKAFVAIGIATMLLNPLVSGLTERLAEYLPEAVRERHPFTLLDLSADDHPVRHHIIAGYGHVGKTMALKFREAGQTVVVLEVDPARMSEAMEDGFISFLGDSMHTPVLEHCWIPQAAGLILTYSQAIPMAVTVARALELNPDLPISIRVRRGEEEHHLERLLHGRKGFRIVVGEHLVAPAFAELMMEWYGIRRVGPQSAV